MTLTSRAEALFTSSLQPSAAPRQADVDAAIRASVRAHHGVRGCAEALAAEYGEHPDVAIARMRWALMMVTAA
jgi:hypothetical protein